MKKIVIVEDTSVLKIRLEKILNRNIEATIESISSTVFHTTFPQHILSGSDLIIVDLDTPEKNGVKVIELIKSRNKTDNYLIMGLSKDADVSLLKSAVVAGCSDLVIKPFNSNVLIHKVKKLLGNKNIEESSPNQIDAADVEIDKDMKNAGFIQWEKNFEIGVNLIDKEHKEIIEKYEKLYVMMREGRGHKYYTELLSFLNDYVNTHFTHEEMLHVESNYDLRLEHVKIHNEFKASVKRLYELGRDKETTDLDLIKINLFIRNWLVHHILIEDGKFGEFLETI